MVRVIGLIIGLLATSVHAEELTGQVIKVNDGDTLILRIAGQRPVKVRLAGIDAPEYDQPYGKTARRVLTAIVSGRTVRVNTRSRDDYGRIVGTVTLSGSPPISSSLRGKPGRRGVRVVAFAASGGARAAPE